MTTTTTWARARTALQSVTPLSSGSPSLVGALCMPAAFALAALFVAVLAGCGDTAVDESPPLADDGAPPPAQPSDPPRVTGGDRFLVGDGQPTAEDAQAYAESLEVDIAGAGADIDAWRAAVLGDLPLIEALYRNTADLGFWRELACTETIDRDVGGCAVRNWAGPEDKEAGAANLGTVAMRLDGEGRVEFYAFGPDGKRTNAVILDSEGEKLLPNTCTMCHGGDGVVVTRDANGAHVDDAGLGAVFRELEPSQLEPPPGVERADLEDTFQRFNNTIAFANRRVRSEAEGAPAGADHAADSIATYIGEMYARGGPALDVDDPAHLPPSWLGGDPALGGGTAEEAEAKRDLWTALVNPHCMGCHRTSPVDLTEYEAFSSLRAPRDGVSEIERLLALEHDDGTYVMPQAELTYTNIQEDERARAALERWLAIPDVGGGPALE